MKMIGRSTLGGSLLILIASCQSQAHDQTPADVEQTPCQGPDCAGAIEPPPPEPGAAEPPDSADDAPAAAGDTAPPPACSALGQSECEASERCFPITDFRNVYRGCERRGVGCPEVETCASNGEVTTLFPDACIPEGYKERSPSVCEPMLEAR
jgi:hypothetical protein